jgi:hypothetical protein
VDSTRNFHGILACLTPGNELYDSYQERKREIEFDRKVEEMLWTNPTHCIVPDHFDEQ